MRSTLGSLEDALLLALAAGFAFLAVRTLAGLALHVAALLPGAVGRRCRALARRVTPAAVRRGAAAAVALSAWTAVAATGARAQPVQAAAGTLVPSSDPAGTAGPGAARPPGRTGDALDRGPLVLPGPARPLVLVRAGDTLWSIAARHLGPAASSSDIAAAWPRWWAANRDVIGADPARLRPGQRLHPPAGVPIPVP